MSEEFKWSKEDADRMNRSLRWMEREVDTVKERYTSTLDAVRRLEGDPDKAKEFIRLTVMGEDEEGLTAKRIYVRPQAVDYVRAIPQPRDVNPEKYPHEPDINCAVGIRGGGEYVVMHDPEAIVKVIKGEVPSRWE